MPETKMENNLICGVCKNSFSDGEELKKHMIVHIHVQRCSTCGEYYPKFPSPIMHTCLEQYTEIHSKLSRYKDCPPNIHFSSEKDHSDHQQVPKLGYETQSHIGSQWKSISDDDKLQKGNANGNMSTNNSSKYHVIAEWSEMKKSEQGMDEISSKEDKDVPHNEEGTGYEDDSPFSDKKSEVHDYNEQWTSEDEKDKGDSENTDDSHEPHRNKAGVGDTAVSPSGFCTNPNNGGLQSKDGGRECVEIRQDSGNTEESYDGKSEGSQDMVEELKCQICGKGFESSRARKVHQATHPGGFVSDCEFCGKHFKNSSNLARHMRMHRGEKPFRCKICGKRYADNKTLLIHERVHSGFRPHRCEKCGKKFSNPKSYRYHMKQHTGRRTRCETCGKTFASSANLSVHKRTHGDKEFMCDICDKGFFQLGNLRRHHKTHQNDEGGVGTELVMCLDIHDGVYTKSMHIRRKSNLSYKAVENEQGRCETNGELEEDVRQRVSPRRTKDQRFPRQRSASDTLHCGVCGSVFTDYSSLKNHIDLHITPECNNSQKPTNDESHDSDDNVSGYDNLTSSSRLDNTENRDLDHSHESQNAAAFKCRRCQKSFSQQVYLKKHMLLHSNHKGRKDTACEKKSPGTVRRSISPNHLGNCVKHGDGSDNYESKEENSDSGIVASNTSGDQSDCLKTNLGKGRRKYKTAPRNKICEICGKAYSSVKRLKLHRQEHDVPPEAIYTCETCGKSFNRLSGLTRHRKSHAKPRVYSCEYCQKTFTCKSKQEIHTRIHTGERPYKCGDCEKTFAAKSGYHQHRQLHELGKVQCQVCSKILTNTSYLRRHMRIHTQEKPYKCQVCGEAFYMYGTYRNHRLAHQGIPPKVYTKKQPATCEECGKYFLSKYYLISHMRLHTGEKPFVCDICGRGFVQGHGLRRHLQFHEKEKSRPEKKFQCHVCHNFYPDLKNLQRHMIYHNRERNCKCQLCDKAYIRPSHLKRHMIDTHKMNPRTSQKPTALPEPATALDPNAETSVSSVSHQTLLHTDSIPLPTSYTAPVTVATVSFTQTPVPPSSGPGLPSAPMPSSLPMNHPLPHSQQYQQTQDSLQIHTMEPAMFGYF